MWRLVEEFHIFSSWCSLCSPGIWTLFPELFVSGSHLPLCVATVHGCFWTNFVYFLNEKWTPSSPRSSHPGNLNIISTSSIWHSRVRQSTLLLEEFHICSSCWWTRISLRSSHLKIWTLFLLAVIWRWDGVFGGSDAFFALLRVVPELSASFSEPSMAKSSVPSRAPMLISTAFVIIHITFDSLQLVSKEKREAHHHRNLDSVANQWRRSVLKCGALGEDGIGRARLSRPLIARARGQEFRDV